MGASTLPILKKEKSERGRASIRHSLKTGIAKTNSSSSVVGDDAPISSPISSNLSNGGIGNSQSKDVTAPENTKNSFDKDNKSGKIRPLGFDSLAASSESPPRLTGGLRK